MPNRRDFLKASAAGLLGASLLHPIRGQASVAPFKLTASEGEVVFGYNQSIPGPVIRIPQGRESIIQFHNALDEPSSVHWHGLRIDNAMDGVPHVTQPPVLPGERFEYRLQPPDAGTYWYHTHMRSWAQLALGLAGVLIVEEDEPPRVDRDLVFAIDDWRLDRKMQFDTNSLGSMHDWSHGGRLGNYITVNGAAEPVFEVARGERIRLRLVNIANARVMHMLFNEPAISVVAIDGQPVEPFAPESGRIRLAPGQRADLIIDMSADAGSRSAIEVVIGEYAYEIATFVYRQQAKREQLLETPIRLRAGAKWQGVGVQWHCRDAAGAVVQRRARHRDQHRCPQRQWLAARDAYPWASFYARSKSRNLARYRAVSARRAGLDALHRRQPG
jgi:FtsP/CotA-like multicopper oxidase with cupredoxin domain